ncbi:MAG TPA: hypothetical protein VIC55_09105 [Gemmatimonadaceae bacterium]
MASSAGASAGCGIEELMRIAFALVTAVLVSVAPRAARAQRLDVSGGGTVTIGDPVTLVLHAALPAGATVESPPHPRDSLPSSVRLIGVDTIRRAGDGALLYRARVAFYETGSLTSPAFALTYRMPGREALDSVVSGALLVTVMATLPDTAIAMRDIRPFAALGGQESTRWWVAVIAALIAGAIAAIVIRARRRTPARLAVPAESVRPLSAYEAARAHLDAVRRAGWLDGDVERHYEEIAETLRRYLEHAHAVPAVRRTTSELLRTLPDALRAEGMDVELGAMLGEADLVKFARLRPAARPALAFLERATALLDRLHAASASSAPPSPSSVHREHDAIR